MRTFYEDFVTVVMEKFWFILLHFTLVLLTIDFLILTGKLLTI